MASLRKIFVRNKLIWLYGLALAVGVILLKWLELRFVIFNHSFEIYAGAIAIIFTSLGIWLAFKLGATKTVTIEKQVFVQSPPAGEMPDEKVLARAGISKREWEVLHLMAQGLSNQEIGERLYVSTNTIKTHCSSIFEKMDVKRRTQAVDKAKKMGLLA